MEPARNPVSTDGDGTTPIVFFDMDGVLCDFVGQALHEIYDVGLTAYTPRKTIDRWQGLHPGEWDICKVTEITQRQLWETIHARAEVFWTQLLPTPLFYDLMSFSDFYPDVVFGVASSPSRHATSYAGKSQWLIEHGFNLANTMLGSQKHLLAAPGRILVDDNDTNCERWREHGGTAVLVPQIWNARHAIAVNGPDAIWESVERELTQAVEGGPINVGSY